LNGFLVRGPAVLDKVGLWLLQSSDMDKTISVRPRLRMISILIPVFRRLVFGSGTHFVFVFLSRLAFAHLLNGPLWTMVMSSRRRRRRQHAVWPVLVYCPQLPAAEPAPLSTCPRTLSTCASLQPPHLEVQMITICC